VKLTDAQIVANKKLEEAIDECVKQFGLLIDPELGEPQIRTNFIVIVEGLKFDEDGDLSEDFYGMIFPNGVLPRAVAKGLCYEGLYLLDHGTRCDYSGNE
jgi:hypothetical protein